MLLIKRILCFLVAAFLVVLGVLFSNDSDIVWFVIGAATTVLGFALIYVSIKLSSPSYSFLITIVACFLAYNIFFSKFIFGPENREKPVEKISVSEDVSPRKIEPKKRKEVKKKQGVDLDAYPKITGSIEVIHAHLFKIGNRYIRLYGVDAPDNDQLCSSANGSSYNCGEQAASWIRNWIDNNVVVCYLFKINPNGVDLGTCLWGNYDIGAGLVGAGWGIANEKETSIYKPYEAKAKSEFSGLWQGTFYTPEDWRDIKRHRNDFTIKRRESSSGNSLFKSWF